MLHAQHTQCSMIALSSINIHEMLWMLVLFVNGFVVFVVYFSKSKLASFVGYYVILLHNVCNLYPFLSLISI